MDLPTEFTSRRAVNFVQDSVLISTQIRVAQIIIILIFQKHKAINIWSNPILIAFIVLLIIK